MQCILYKLELSQTLETITALGKSKLFYLYHTLLCISIGTPKIIYFPFVPNRKFIILGVPKVGQITA